MTQTPQPQQPPTGWGQQAPPQPRPKGKNWFLRHKILTAILAIFALIVIASVATAGGGSDVRKTTVDQPKTSTAAPPTLDQPSSAPADTSGSSSNVVKIGSTEGFAYEDGLQVAVTSIKRVTFSQYAAGIKPGQIGVLVTVRIKNGSKEAVDLSLTTVNLAAGAAGAQADSVFDDKTHEFDGKIAPGRFATATYGFAINKTDIGTMQVEVEPGFDYESSLFEGTLR